MVLAIIILTYSSVCFYKWESENKRRFIYLFFPITFISFIFLPELLNIFYTDGSEGVVIIASFVGLCLHVGVIGGLEAESKSDVKLRTICSNIRSLEVDEDGFDSSELARLEEALQSNSERIQNAALDTVEDAFGQQPTAIGPIIPVLTALLGTDSEKIRLRVYDMLLQFSIREEKIAEQVQNQGLKNSSRYIENCSTDTEEKRRLQINMHSRIARFTGQELKQTKSICKDALSHEEDHIKRVGARGFANIVRIDPEEFTSIQSQVEDLLESGSDENVRVALSVLANVAYNDCQAVLQYQDLVRKYIDNDNKESQSLVFYFYAALALEEPDSVSISTFLDGPQEKEAVNNAIWGLANLAAESPEEVWNTTESRKELIERVSDSDRNVAANAALGLSRIAGHGIDITEEIALEDVWLTLVSGLTVESVFGKCEMLAGLQTLIDVGFDTQNTQKDTPELSAKQSDLIGLCLKMVSPLLTSPHPQIRRSACQTIVSLENKYTGVSQDNHISESDGKVLRLFITPSGDEIRYIKTPSRDMNEVIRHEIESLQDITEYPEVNRNINKMLEENTEAEK
jgi:hypothetical protein